MLLWAKATWALFVSRLQIQWWHKHNRHTTAAPLSYTSCWLKAVSSVLDPCRGRWPLYVSVRPGGGIQKRSADECFTIQHFENKFVTETRICKAWWEEVTKRWVAKECDKREVEWGWRREHLAWKLLLYNKVSLCFSFLFPSPLPPASETWIFEFHSLVVWTFRPQPEWVIATYLLQYSVVALVLLTNVSLLTTDLLSFICSVVEFVPLPYLLLDFIVVAVSHRPLEGVCKVLLIVLLTFQNASPGVDLLYYMSL